MKKLILFITTFLTLLSFTVTTYAETPNTNKNHPIFYCIWKWWSFKIEIHDNRSREHGGYARPYTKSSYQFSGGVSITLTNGRTLYYQ